MGGIRTTVVHGETGYLVPPRDPDALAVRLGERIREQTIVLTGAMVPYTCGSSDGLFNLGDALAFAQTLPHGVYVVMNGRAFDWENVRKNRGTGRFEELGG